jgi:hypothetical protein
MQISDLSLDQLDYWVARARGIDTFHAENGELMYLANPKLPPRPWKPTRFWSQGGPIIEEAHIDLNWDTEGTGRWAASLEPDVLTDGQTILIATMRAYVVSRFGTELPS